MSQPKVWEGLPLLAKHIGAKEAGEKMCICILTLPLTQLHEVLHKSPEYRPALLGALRSPAATATKNGMAADKKKLLGV